MKELYMIGNSHIDAVWFWNWEEGMQEVRATISSALERMKEYEEFCFTCSSTAYLEWIEKNDPDLFEEVKRRAAQGRLEIVGGWYVEPDCLLPCGEAFVRHALYGQRYLLSRFGKKCTIGFNIDSFGHNANLPQILKKSDMTHYVFMRPRLEESLFRWQAKDGSTVDALCLPGEYTTWFHGPTVENIEVTLKRTPQWNRMTVCYGVGNHGGGPTIENIESVISLKHSFPDTVLRFSTFRQFFDDMHPENQELRTGAFEKINQGCYVIDSAFKKLNKEAERRLLETDALLAMTYLRTGRWTEAANKMESLWKILLFNEFHDTFGGTIIRAARDGAMMQISSVCAGAGVLRNDLVQTLVKSIPAKGYGFPVFILNPGGSDYQGPVEMELEWFCQSGLKLMNDRGEEVPYQRIYTDAKVRHTVLGGRRRLLFETDTPAYGYSVFYVTEETGMLCRNNDFELDNADAHVLDNGIIRAEFDQEDGSLLHLIELETGYDALKEPARFALYRDERDAWGGLQGRVFENRHVRFVLDSIEKIQSGFLRETIRVRSRFEDTVLEQHYSLEKGSDALRMEITVRFNHPWHLLSYCIPVGKEAVYSVSETAYGTVRRKHEDSEEYNMQSFVDICDENGGGLSIANDSVYGFHVEDGCIDLSLLRSAIYAQGSSPDWYNTVETYRYTDIGEHDFAFLLRPHQDRPSGGRLFSLSDRLNRRCEYLLDTIHKNTNALKTGECAAVSVDSENVRIALMKKAEDSDELIIRLLECDGRDTVCTLCIGGRRFMVQVGHDAVETFKLTRGGQLIRTNLLEEVQDEQ